MPASCSAASSLGEALEFQAGDAGSALELGQQRAQRVAAVQLVGAVGDRDEQPGGGRAAHEVVEEVARGGIGPVEVFEDQQQRALGSEALEQHEQRLEQAALAHRLVGRRGSRRAGAQLGKQAGQRRSRGLAEIGGQRAVAGDRAQGGDERGVRDLRAAELQAVAREHARARQRGPALELAHEARLAHAGFARDEHEGRRAGRRPLQRGVERRELGTAPDEGGAPHPLRHGAHHGALSGPPGRAGRARRDRGGGGPGVEPRLRGTARGALQLHGARRRTGGRAWR
jgi:hypothetical protein